MRSEYDERIDSPYFDTSRYHHQIEYFCNVVLYSALPQPEVQIVAKHISKASFDDSRNHSRDYLGSVSGSPTRVPSEQQSGILYPIDIGIPLIVPGGGKDSQEFPQARLNVQLSLKASSHQGLAPEYSSESHKINFVVLLFDLSNRSSFEALEKLYEEFVGDHRGNISSSITVLLVGKVQKSDAPQAVSRAEIDHWCELYQSAVRVVYLEYTVLYAQGSRDLLALLIEPYQSQYTTHCTKRKQAESPHRISNNGAHHFFHSTFDDGVRDDSEKVRKDEKKRNERQRKLEDMASQMRLMMESDQLEHENIEKQQREQEQQHQKHLLQQQQLQQQIAAKRAKRKPLVPLNTSSSSSQQPPGAPSNPPSNTSTPTSTMAAAMFGMMWLGSRSDDSETQPPPPPTVISSSHLQQQQQTMTLHQVQQKPLRRTTSAISAASGRSHNSTGRTHQAANGGDPHHSLHANRHSSDITSLIETMHSAVKAEESLLQRSLYMRDPYNYYDDEDEFEDVDEEIDACTEPGGTFAREESSDLDSSVFGNSRPASMNLTQQLGRRSISVNAALSLEARGLIVNPAYIEDGSPEADRDTPRGPEERPSMMGRQSSAVMSLMSESVRESVGSTTSNAHNNYQKPPLRANTSATGAGVNSASSRHVQKTPTTLPSVKEAPGGGSKSVDTSTELEEIGNYRKRRTTAGSFLMGCGCM